MQQKDEFGHDPGVQRTRAYFSRMEALDSALITQSGISRFDLRLRPARALRFRLFEAACSRACHKGQAMNDQKTMALFEICQALAFKNSGLPVSLPSGDVDPDLAALAKEGAR